MDKKTNATPPALSTGRPPQMITFGEGKDEGWHRKIVVMERLSKFLTVRELEQMADAMEQVAGRGEMPDLVIRWKNGHPRWIGMMVWDVLGREE